MWDRRTRGLQTVTNASPHLCTWLTRDRRATPVLTRIWDSFRCWCIAAGVETVEELLETSVFLSGWVYKHLPTLYVPWRLSKENENSFAQMGTLTCMADFSVTAHTSEKGLSYGWMNCAVFTQCDSSQHQKPGCHAKGGHGWRCTWEHSWISKTLSWGGVKWACVLHDSMWMWLWGWQHESALTERSAVVIAGVWGEECGCKGLCVSRMATTGTFFPWEEVQGVPSIP